MAYEPSLMYSSGLEGTRVRYSAGMIWSVSMFWRGQGEEANQGIC